MQTFMTSVHVERSSTFSRTSKTRPLMVCTNCKTDFFYTSPSSPPPRKPVNIAIGPFLSCVLSFTLAVFLTILIENIRRPSRNHAFSQTLAERNLGRGRSVASEATIKCLFKSKRTHLSPCMAFRRTKAS